MINKDLKKLAEVLEEAGFRITNFKLEVNDDQGEEREVFNLEVFKVPEDCRAVSEGASADNKSFSDEAFEKCIKRDDNLDALSNILSPNFLSKSQRGVQVPENDQVKNKIHKIKVSYNLKNLTGENLIINLDSKDLTLLAKAEILIPKLENRVLSEADYLNINIKFFKPDWKNATVTVKATEEEANLLNSVAQIIKRAKEKKGTSL